MVYYGFDQSTTHGHLKFLFFCKNANNVVLNEFNIHIFLLLGLGLLNLRMYVWELILWHFTFYSLLLGHFPHQGIIISLTSDEVKHLSCLNNHFTSFDFDLVYRFLPLFFCLILQSWAWYFLME
jgi:hypothetical protein